MHYYDVHVSSCHNNNSQKREIHEVAFQPHFNLVVDVIGNNLKCMKFYCCE